MDSRLSTSNHRKPHLHPSSSHLLSQINRQRLRRYMHLKSSKRHTCSQDSFSSMFGCFWAFSGKPCSSDEATPLVLMPREQEARGGPGGTMASFLQEPSSSGIEPDFLDCPSNTQIGKCLLIFAPNRSDTFGSCPDLVTLIQSCVSVRIKPVKGLQNATRDPISPSHR